MKKLINIKTKISRAQKIMFMMTMFFVMGIVYSAKADGPDLPAEGDAPIDGGLSLLVAAGVGYGAKKVREKRKQNNSVEK